MAATNFDLIVLGLGPGGEDVAGSVADAGWSVLGVDPALVGGECPYYGCIPSKMILRGAELLAEARRVPGVAGQLASRPNWLPSRTGSAMRPPTTGTTRPPSSASNAGARRSCGPPGG